ncbi:MAG: hypothetical protein COY66_02365 [Candidatus Kerfeldbacteria bacterium CG_4_10_14_0_8_um_filter_42_10]|uniref:Uncharacterized protein n=1 Tax=Candidatus Kerfeldbacteria bacterium CG_4_10_14_0_8_um_filter_42_10 TaxID=2014248 RepID=A0A2M7RJE1_9BACT|nr:MAG: hypothetical protein COY66_02365 [Candidatus Kerfeldbacteria bacterium CG_4_10_14_0_8_um_filter_42_10]
MAKAKTLTPPSNNWSTLTIRSNAVILVGPIGLGRLSIDAAKAEETPISSKKMMNITEIILESVIFIVVNK